MAFQLGCWPFFPPPRFQSLSAFAPPAPLFPVCQLLSYLTLPYTFSAGSTRWPSHDSEASGNASSPWPEDWLALGDLLALPPGIAVSQVIQVPL